MDWMNALDPLGRQHVHKVVKFELRHTPPLSMRGMAHREPILGAIASIIWSSCVGLYRHPNVGNQGEWCDLISHHS